MGIKKLVPLSSAAQPRNLIQDEFSHIIPGFLPTFLLKILQRRPFAVRKKKIVLTYCRLFKDASIDSDIPSIRYLMLGLENYNTLT